MKIAVYAISKNESQFVKRFCDSAQDADLILIADTGSTDDTVELARKCGAVVYDICVTPWRFDKARDAALALIPKDYDICVSLDLDEVLEPSWREEVERLWQDKTTRLRYKFDWSQGVVFYSEKIHSRHGYHWHHPCHEYIRADARIQEVYAHTDKLLVTHLPDPTKSRSQYMDLLKLSVEEDPLCSRNAFYYARELVFYQQWNQAIAALKKYLDMPSASWSNERSYAMRCLAKSYQGLGDYTAAIKWAMLAAAESPKSREPWVELADIYHKQQQWHNCFSASKTAVDITDKELVYTVDPAAWGSKPHDLLALSAYNLGLYDLAVEHGKIAVDLEPNDPRLVKNLEFYLNKLD
jgi:tetratricopeptide (TPR) repeat protein